MTQPTKTPPRAFALFDKDGGFLWTLRDQGLPEERPFPISGHGTPVRILTEEQWQGMVDAMLELRECWESGCTAGGILRAKVYAALAAIGEGE